MSPKDVLVIEVPIISDVTSCISLVKTVMKFSKCEIFIRIFKRQNYGMSVDLLSCIVYLVIKL